MVLRRELRARAGYLELVRRADTAAFIQCHVNAFEYLGSVPRKPTYQHIFGSGETGVSA